MAIFDPRVWLVVIIVDCLIAWGAVRLYERVFTG